MQSRHLSRQVALQAIASLLLEAGDSGERFDFVQKELTPRLSSPCFAREIFDGVCQDREKLDQHITRFAPEWPVEKLDPVERAILEIGAFELLMCKTPPPIVINESVELAKEFCDESASKFINGVLNAIAHDGH